MCATLRHTWISTKKLPCLYWVHCMYYPGLSLSFELTSLPGLPISAKVCITTDAIHSIYLIYFFTTARTHVLRRLPTPPWFTVTLLRFTLSTRLLRLVCKSSPELRLRDRTLAVSRSPNLSFCLFDRSSRSADMLFVFLKLKVTLSVFRHE
jgi:hypothetical protein